MAGTYNGSQGPSRTVLVHGETLADINMNVSGDGHLRVQQPEFINVQVAYSKNNISATAWALLIDLSDTVNWPHEPGLGLDISYMSIQIDKATSTRGRLQVGVVTRIDGTDGDVSIFRGIVFAQDEGGRVDRVENYSPSQIRTEVVSGDTPHILTSNRYLNEAAINTATPLDSPIGAASVVPDVGDIVVRYQHDAGGNWNAAVSALYSANPSFV